MILRALPSFPLLVVAATLAALVVAAPARMAAQRTSAAARKPVPAFAMKDQKGTPVAWPAYKGKVVLLNFWATWCTGCKEEMPWFVEFQKKYARDGLAVLGVALDDEGWATVKPYLAGHPVNYPIAVAAFDVLEKPLELDPVLPATLLIDRAGNIADRYTGVIKREVFEAKLKALLAETLK
jgi:cytochrome c biogenesis protein CcmG/thiol:disulfide interchange protein DsbE